jgi:hypothetical protein
MTVYASMVMKDVDLAQDRPVDGLEAVLGIEQIVGWGIYIPRTRGRNGLELNYQIMRWV